ncbi:hypothetical protein [Hyphococcus sp.]|uniref:hypothetical protein n=1 Tax=Hyphococcus sp. TaxID=2038636 RepID=UPI003CCBC116
MNKRLLNGRPGQPDNYELSLVLMNGDYKTPRHRHNFDQIRYMIEGEFGYGRSKDEIQQQGTASYFPEGVYYEQQAIGRSVTLLFQGGGPSGAGFLSYDQLEEGFDTLGEEGTFSNGVYTWIDEDGGKHNKDAYEAIWERIRGKTLAYPKPRYRTPIIADVNHYDWTPTSEEGVEARHMGAFTERSIAFGFLKLDRNAMHVCAPHGIYYFLSGEGAVAREAYVTGAAAAMDGEEGRVIRAASPTQLAYILLPRFS